MNKDPDTQDACLIRSLERDIAILQGRLRYESLTTREERARAERLQKVVDEQAKRILYLEDVLFDDAHC